MISEGAQSLQGFNDFEQGRESGGVFPDWSNITVLSLHVSDMYEKEKRGMFPCCSLHDPPGHLTS